MYMEIFRTFQFQLQENFLTFNIEIFHSFSSRCFFKMCSRNQKDPIVLMEFGVLASRPLLTQSSGVTE